MRSILRSLVLTTMAGAFLLHGYARAEDPTTHAAAREAWVPGFQKVEEADTSEALKQYGLALGLYKEALVVFRKVAADYPDWRNAKLVEYRITYCQDRIRRLETALAVDADKRDKPALLESVHNLGKETKQLRGQLGEANAKLTEQTSRASALTATLDAAKGDLRTTKQDLVVARKDAGDKARELSDLSAKLATFDALQKEHKDGLQTVKELEKELGKSKQNAIGAQAKQAEAEKKLVTASIAKEAAESDLQTARKSAESAQTQVAVLRKDVDAGVAKASGLEAEAKGLREKVASLQADVAAKTASERQLLDEKRRLAEAAQREKNAAKQREQQLADYLTSSTDALRKKQTAAAVRNLEKALALDPENVTVLKQLGRAMTEKGRHSDAEAYLTRAFKHDPTDPEILVPLGFALLRQEKSRLAVAVLTRAVAVDPDKADPRRVLGVACGAIGWADAAESEFKQSFKLDSKNPETAYNLALLYATLKQPRMTEAREWYDKARKLGARADSSLEKFLNFGK